MLNRYVVYTAQSAAALTPEALWNALAECDLAAAAEIEGAGAESLAMAMETLQVENEHARGFSSFRIGFLPDGRLPIRVTRWPLDAAMRSEAIVELIEHPSRLRLTPRIHQAVDRIELTFGRSSQEAMAPALAGLAASLLVSWYGGVFEAYDRTWFEIDPEQGQRLVPPDRAVPPVPARVPIPTQPAARRRPVPVACPTCKETLYPPGARKPEPSLSTSGRVVMAVAAIVAAGVFLGLGMSEWLFGGADAGAFRVHVPGVSGMIYMIIALVPGLVIGLLAYRFGRVMRVRCRKCGWRGVFSIG